MWDDDLEKFLNLDKILFKQTFRRLDDCPPYRRKHYGDRASVMKRMSMFGHRQLPMSQYYKPFTNPDIDKQQD